MIYKNKGYNRLFAAEPNYLDVVFIEESMIKKDSKEQQKTKV